MLIRPWAEFTSDLPTDEIENEDGTDFIQYPGKSVAEAVHEILGRLGCELLPVTHAHEHGWEFNFEYKKRRLWCQVTLIEKYLLVVDEISMLRKLFGRPPHADYLEILSRLAQEMARDPRFEEVLWYASHQVHSGAPGARSPVPAAA